MITSRQSFDAFVVAGYKMLPLLGDVSDAMALNALYDWAADYNPLNRAPKQALAGTALYRAMFDYVEATLPHRIVMQTGEGPWRDLTGITDTLALYYGELAQDRPQRPVVPADQLVSAYLHVYPDAPAAANWRIGINVEPSATAAAMAALTPLLDAYPDIDHMKFLGPASIEKPDSVIVYLRRTENYAALRQAVLDATAPLAKQARVGAMWNEIADGIGEAAEPPDDGLSFTAYRCLVFYLAYRQYHLAAENPAFDDFKLYLAQVMALFGLDPASPHTQGPLLMGNPLYPSWRAGFDALNRAWQG
jgi:hypothetical protein